MKTIYAFCGLSGTGKTTIANAISELLDIPFIISHTTRPIRPGEEHVIDYYFITKSHWDKLIDNQELVAAQTFNIATKEVWNYGILKEHLQDTCIMVLTPSGIKDLKEAGYHVISIYIELDEEVRLNRIKSRKDNQAEIEITRRSKDDKKIFNAFKPDYIIHNDGCISDSIVELFELNIF